MGRSKNALAFAAGLGEGYVDAGRQKKLDEEHQQDREMRQRQLDAQMEEADRIKQNRIALANAAKPAVVNENAATLDMGDGPKVYEDAGVANSDMRQARTMGLADVQAPSKTIAVNGKSFASRPEADAAATAYNTPEARRARQADALDAQGNPTAAIALQNATLSQDAVKRTQADAAWRQKVGTAMQSGHDGLAQLASQTEVGPLAGKKVKPVPSADGKTVTYNLVGDDGTLTPTSLTFSNDQNGVIQAGYLLDRAITPEHRMEGLRKDRELDRKTTADENRFEYQKGLIDTKIKQLELTGQIAEAKALKAAGNGGALGKEERLRYTTLFSEAGRRVGEAQKALGALQKDVVFMSQASKPGSPQAAQLAELQQAIKDHNDERLLYQGLLAGSQGGKAPALGDAKPSAAPGEPVKVSSKAERDKLPKGARYIGPDGVAYIKQ